MANRAKRLKRKPRELQTGGESLGFSDRFWADATQEQ
jgi:hypothetical protein